MWQVTWTNDKIVFHLCKMNTKMYVCTPCSHVHTRCNNYANSLLPYDSGRMDRIVHFLLNYREKVNPHRDDQRQHAVGYASGLEVQLFHLRCNVTGVSAASSTGCELGCCHDQLLQTATLLNNWLRSVKRWFGTFLNLANWTCTFKVHNHYLGLFKVNYYYLVSIQHGYCANHRIYTTIKTQL